MSRLLELQARLVDVGAAIARAERAVAAHPEIQSGSATLRSFEKMRADCEREFLWVTNSLEKDVCSYRIILDGSRATLAGIAAVLGDFQAMFTSVYDSVVNGPKKIARIADDIVRASEFGFGYTFSGSVGVMLTLDNKRGLFGESESRLDDAISGIFEIITAKDTDAIKKAAHTYGVAALKAVHNWAEANAAAEFGTDIVWMRKENVKSQVCLERPQVRMLASVIRDATHTTEERVTGELRMKDADTRQFRMLVKDKEISGRFENTISIASTVVPATYNAVIRVSHPVISDSELSASYVLLDLSPDDGRGDAW